MPLLALLALHVIVAAWGIRLAAIDAAYHRLPDRLTGSLAIVLVVWAVMWGERPLLMEAFQDSALTTAAYALCAVLPAKPLGWGDVKLQASLGFYTSLVFPGGGLIQASLAFVLGGMGAGWLLVRGKIRADEGVAFGPFMVAAAFVTIAAAESLKII